MRKIAVVLLGCALLAGCDAILGPVDHVVVYGFRPVLVVGERQSFSAGAFTDGGSQRPSGGYRWRSSDPAVASVSSNGTVTARAPGVARIEASARGATGRLDVNVIPPISAVRLRARPDTLRVGERGRLEADAFDLQGARVAVAWINFVSSDVRIVGVDSVGGLYANGATGRALITGKLNGRSDSVFVVVVPARAAARAREEGPCSASC